METFSEDSAIEILKRNNNYNSFYSPKTLDALLYLASIGNTNKITLIAFERWITMGAMQTKGGADHTQRAEFPAANYTLVCAAFATLAENKLEALEFLTKRIIDGWDDMPWVEHEGLLDAFFMMNPQKALPETKDCINKILGARGARTTVIGDRLVSFKRKMPIKGFFDWLNSF